MSSDGSKKVLTVLMLVGMIGSSYKVALARETIAQTQADFLCDSFLVDKARIAESDQKMTTIFERSTSSKSDPLTVASTRMEALKKGIPENALLNYDSKAPQRSLLAANTLMALLAEQSGNNALTLNMSPKERAAVFEKFGNRLEIISKNFDRMTTGIKEEMTLPADAPEKSIVDSNAFMMMNAAITASVSDISPDQFRQSIKNFIQQQAQLRERMMPIAGNLPVGGPVPVDMAMGFNTSGENAPPMPEAFTGQFGGPMPVTSELEEESAAFGGPMPVTESPFGGPTPVKTPTPEAFQEAVDEAVMSFGAPAPVDMTTYSQERIQRD